MGRELEVEKMMHKVRREEDGDNDDDEAKSVEKDGS